MTTEMHDIPADRNKTNLTHEVTEAAAHWLESIGAKCIETEVPVGPKWIADLAAYWRPTRTEAIKQKLIPRAKPYPYGYGSVDSLMQEYQASRQAQFEAYRKIPEIVTIVVEVKTSKADFKRDLQDKFLRPAVADLQVIAAPRLLFSDVSIYPDDWWVVGVDIERLSPVEGDLDIWRKGGLRSVSVEQKLNFVAAVGERRHNRTANMLWTALGKRRREDERLQKELKRI